MNDLISRSYILNIIEMWMKVPSYSESERNIMRAIDYEVRTAPSAEPWNTVFLNCQAECEVQKDIGIACIHYEKAHDIEPGDK